MWLHERLNTRDSDPDILILKGGNHLEQIFTLKT